MKKLLSGCLVIVLVRDEVKTLNSKVGIFTSNNNPSKSDSFVLTSLAISF